jgi:hypothetical protein
MKNGDLPGARQTADLAKTAAKQVPDYLSRTVFGAVARAEVKVGKPSIANMVMEESSHFTFAVLPKAFGESRSSI